MKLFCTLIAIVFLSGCATSNIRVSAEMCRAGDLAAYEDEDFRMRCQEITKHIYEGNVPQTIIHEQKVGGETVLRGYGPYGRDIISVVKRR